MPCNSNVLNCDEEIIVENDYSILIKEVEENLLKVSDFWLYDSFNPEDTLEDQDEMTELKLVWDFPNAEVFVSCGTKAECRSNFRLMDDGCYISSDFQVMFVKD